MRSSFLPLAFVVLMSLPAVAPAQQKPADPASPPSEVGGKTLEQWIKDLRNPDPSLRLEAVRAVQFFGEDSKKAVTELIFLLGNDRDVSLRANVCIALNNVEVRKGDVSAVVKELQARIEKDVQAVVRYHACVVIGRFEEEARTAIPTMIMASKDPASFEIRKAAVASLARAGFDEKAGPDPKVTAALLAALKDHSADVRLEAVSGLGALGEPQPNQKAEVIRALQIMESDRDKAVAIWSLVASMALDKTNPKDLATVAKYLQADDARTRLNAARGLGMLGADAKPRVGDLVDALKDKEAVVVASAAWALGEIGKKADPGPEATAALTALTQKKDVQAGVKTAAEEAIDKIKGKGKEKEKN